MRKELPHHLDNHVTRKELPHRRASDTFEMNFNDQCRPISVTLGRYADGSIGEVFINSGKSGEQVESIARDGAVLLSLALQYGAPIEELANPITRNPGGEPQSIVGAVLDEIVRRERRLPPPNDDEPQPAPRPKAPIAGPEIARVE